jgi:very-short-patch-repair endonuclease
LFKESDELSKAKIIKEKQTLRDMSYIRDTDPKIDFLPDDQHASLIKMIDFRTDRIIGNSIIKRHIIEKLKESKMILCESEDNYKLSQTGNEYLFKIKQLKKINQERNEYIDRHTLSIKIRLLRKVNKLSVIKMAEKVNLTPIDILNIEGTGKCNLNHVELICEIFNIDTINFLTKPLPQSINLENIHFTDSEIEEKLLNELLRQLKHHKDYKIETQKDFVIYRKNYRVDFLITYKDDQNNIFKLVVECDGHNYHERTKEQARKDKSRDRDFLRIGIPTIRFTGAEIYEDSSECAHEIFGVLWSYARCLSFKSNEVVNCHTYTA